MFGHDLLLLAVLCLLLALAALGRTVARAGRQPAVIGEIVVGVLLGPTLLHGHLSAALVPVAVRPELAKLANVGVVLFVFLLGLELDTSAMLGRRGMIGSVSVGAMLAPFAGGLFLAWRLPSLQVDGAHTGSILFIGIAMSVTAFPVLARVIVDRGLAGTPLAVRALSSAAICDAIAWTGLILLLTFATENANAWRITLLVPFAVVLFGPARPLLRSLARAGQGLMLTRIGSLAFVGAGLWATSDFTKWAGLDAIIGAFLFGAAVARPGSHSELGEADTSVVATGAIKLASRVLLPVYFVVAGLKVNLNGFDSHRSFELAAILAVAVAGKLLGVYVPARMSRLSPRDSLAWASVINMRGLTELVVLSAGLHAGLISANTYSLMVVMAIVTTVGSGMMVNFVARSALAEPTVLRPRPVVPIAVGEAA